MAALSKEYWDSGAGFFTLILALRILEGTQAQRVVGTCPGSTAFSAGLGQVRGHLPAWRDSGSELGRSKEEQAWK